MGEKGFVSNAPWPAYEESRVDHAAEESEALIKSVLDDTASIMRATKITPKTVCLYTASSWKWKAYQKALKASLEKERLKQGDLMRELMNDGEMKKRAKEVAGYVSQIVEEVNRTGRDRREAMLAAKALDEASVLVDAGDFLKRELNAEIRVYVEDDERRYDPKKRAQLAKPYRPAIYMEPA
jgi:leucyl-tRNA synthetase